MSGWKMKYLVVIYFTAIFGVSFGVKWNDFRGGNIKLPITLKQAEEAGWVLCEQDDTHNMKWYSKDNDWAFSVAFDQKSGDCAGVRVIIYESEIDSDYLKLYKQPDGIFEQIEFHGEKAYKSTVLFSPKGYVTKNGQDTKDVDEVAYFAFLREGSNHKMLYREICAQAERSYIEQGCHSSYGLILSGFQSDTKCKKLKPFYTIYDPNGSGDLIGFGWISFSTVSKPDSIIKQLSTDTAKSLFPQSPSCLTSGSSLAIAEVWLSFSDGQQTSCSSTSWVDKNCKNTDPDQKKKMEHSQSFWDNLFG